jgi:hypothetical protein
MYFQYLHKCEDNKDILRQAHGWWFSPGTPASSTTVKQADRHDIAEILLKVALSTTNQSSFIQTIIYKTYT